MIFVTKLPLDEILTEIVVIKRTKLRIDLDFQGHPFSINCWGCLIRRSNSTEPWHFLSSTHPLEDLSLRDHKVIAKHFSTGHDFNGKYERRLLFK